jgi:hypothetical protein
MNMSAALETKEGTVEKDSLVSWLNCRGKTPGHSRVWFFVCFCSTSSDLSFLARLSSMTNAILSCDGTRILVDLSGDDV